MPPLSPQLTVNCASNNICTLFLIGTAYSSLMAQLSTTDHNDKKSSAFQTIRPHMDQHRIRKIKDHSWSPAVKSSELEK